MDPKWRRRGRERGQEDAMPKWIQVGEQRLNLDAVWAMKWERDCLAVYVPGAPRPQKFEGQVAQRMWDYAQGEVWEQPPKRDGKTRVVDSSRAGRK
jgi:hypothetical protein